MGQGPAGGEGAPPKVASSAAQALARERPGKAFGEKQGPRKPDCSSRALGAPTLKWRFAHFSLRSYREGMGYWSRRYLPCNRQAAAGDETLESEVMGCDRGLWRSKGAVHTGSARTSLRDLGPTHPRTRFSPSVGPSLPTGRVRPRTRRSKTTPAGSAVTRGPFVKNTSAERSTCS